MFHNNNVVWPRRNILFYSILGIEEYFNIRKSINVIDCITKFNKKNKIVTSVHVEKAFNTVQKSILISNKWKESI